VKNEGFNYVERGDKQVFVSVVFALNFYINATNVEANPALRLLLRR
jgi:hypothetical protein